MIKTTAQNKLNNDLIVELTYRHKIQEKSFLSIIALAQKKNNHGEVAKALNKIGYQYYLEGEFIEACTCFELAIKYDPKFTHGHFNLASTYDTLANIKLAFNHYKIAAKYKNKVGYAATNNLSRLNILNRNFEDAISQIKSVLNKVEDINIKTSLFKNLAWAYFELGQLNEAEKYVKQSLNLDNNYIPALYLSVLVLLYQADMGEKKSWQKAQDLWEKCQANKAKDQFPAIINALSELTYWSNEVERKLNISAQLAS